MPADIALVTERRYEAPSSPDAYVGNILAEDRLLTDALAALDLSAERVDWSREDVDWDAYRAVVVRTTWDYFERFEAFMAWLQRIAEHPCVLNPVELMQWNIDKHYLADLEAAGLPIVPTRFVERGAGTTLTEAMAALDASEVVFKPAVSGAARETYRVRAGEADAHAERFAALVTEHAMLVQPFMPSIVEHGEVTVVVMNGVPTHAIRKQAKAGDFRVQDDHGGTVHDHAATPAELSLATAAMASCKHPPVYGRVDMVRSADGMPAIIELELIEPELWLRFEPAAATAFAEGIAAALALQ
ncbi:MAG: hypothetical protein AAGA54_18055 [Myxococcota bacterium]